MNRFLRTCLTQFSGMHYLYENLFLKANLEKLKFL